MALVHVYWKPLCVEPGDIIFWSQSALQAHLQAQLIRCFSPQLWTWQVVLHTFWKDGVKHRLYVWQGMAPPMLARHLCARAMSRQSTYSSVDGLTIETPYWKFHVYSIGQDSTPDEKASSSLLAKKINEEELGGVAEQIHQVQHEETDEFRKVRFIALHLEQVSHTLKQHFQEGHTASSARLHKS